MRLSYKLKTLGLFIVTTALLTGCSENSAINLPVGESQTEDNKRLPASPFDVNKFSLNKLVCDPFDPVQPGTNYEQGLSAELYSLNEGQSFGSVDEYINQGLKSDQQLFFSKVNVPTRLFDQGFPTELGDLIQDDNGQVLLEWFALRLESQLKLKEDQQEGLYQLALLSDDGSILSVKDADGNLQVLVDNDGNHPSKFGCGSVIEMKQGEAHEIELKYYQGPRYHISLIPMWRKIDSLEDAGDPLCGQKGNKKFFDFNNNSEPKQAYLDLLARGWEPIEAENYQVPAEDEYNPCAGTNPPEISEFYIIDLLDGGVRVIWQTDIPATSQVMYTSSVTGTPITTVSDNLLRTSHSVDIPDPQSGESYLIRAISISATLGKTVSSGKIYRGRF